MTSVLFQRTHQGLQDLALRRMIVREGQGVHRLTDVRQIVGVGIRDDAAFFKIRIRLHKAVQLLEVLHLGTGEAGIRRDHAQVAEQ